MYVSHAWAGSRLRSAVRLALGTTLGAFTLVAHVYDLSGVPVDVVGGVVWIALLAVTLAMVVRGGSRWPAWREAVPSILLLASVLVARFGWLGLCPQAGLALALAELVKRAFPEFGDDAFALVVGVVATNEMLMPILLRVALLRSGEAGRRAVHEPAAPH